MIYIVQSKIAGNVQYIRRMDQVAPSRSECKLPQGKKDKEKEKQALKKEKRKCRSDDIDMKVKIQAWFGVCSYRFGGGVLKRM